MKNKKLQALIGAIKNIYTIIQSKLRLLTCWQQAVGKTDCTDDVYSSKYYYLDENKYRIYNDGSDSWFYKYVSFQCNKSRNLSNISIGISLFGLCIIFGRLLYIIIMFYQA